MFKVPIPDPRSKFLIKNTRYNAYHFQVIKYKSNNLIIDPFTYTPSNEYSLAELAQRDVGIT